MNDQTSTSARLSSKEMPDQTVNQTRMNPEVVRSTIMVVIASYGNGNDPYLRRLLAEFRSMQLRLDLHVISNAPKELGTDVTVHVGLPSRNPRSLPFAHRQLFAEHLAKADFFIYCEDDTLITEQNIRAFLQVNQMMGPDEIPGFLRVEQVTPQECYVECAHGPYRWDPASLVQRGPLLFASFTNFHSALTVASRAQVQRAIDSGGFLVGPHVGWGGMLECAASDIYTQCGLNRLICISRIEDFLVPHLSNKNSLKWGLCYEEFVIQTKAFQRMNEDSGWNGSLLEVETRMTRRRWSKNLYEKPDPSVLELIPREAGTVLSVGTGWGASEEFLKNQGRQVTGIPMDAVFSDCLRRRGIEAVEGSFEDVVEKLSGRQFDAILMLDVLQLTPNPVEWLTRLRSLLTPRGMMLATVPRTFDPFRLIWYLRGEPATAFPKRYSDSLVQRVNRSRLFKWFGAAGLCADIQAVRTTPKRVRIEERLGTYFSRPASDRFVVLARLGSMSSSR